MKVLLFSSLAALAYGAQYTNSATYIRVDMRGAGGADASAVTDCSANITRSILMKPIKNGTLVAQIATHPTEYTYSLARNGTCVSFDLDSDDPQFQPDVTFSNSFGLYATDDAGKYAVAQFAAFDCSGNGAVDTTGFVFAPDVSGTSDCAGVISTNSTAGGLELVAAAQSIAATGTLFKSKRALIGQLNGPFTTDSCNVLAGSKTSNSLPVVIPLEAAAATSAPYNESAISASGLCFNFGQTIAAPGAHILKASTTSTAGELVFEISTGSGVGYTNRTTCTHGTTYSKITFAVLNGGNFSRCVQSYDNASPPQTQSQKFWSFQPDAASIGEWVSFPAASPTTTATPCTASPATTLHLSALMAALYATIAMMM